MAAKKNGSSKGVTSPRAGAKTTVNGKAKNETAKSVNVAAKAKNETPKSVNVAAKAKNETAKSVNVAAKANEAARPIKSKAAAVSAAATSTNETAKAAKGKGAAVSSAVETSGAVAKQATAKTPATKGAKSVATSAARMSAGKSAPTSPAAKDAAKKTLARSAAAKVGDKASLAASGEPVVSEDVTLIKASHPVRPKARSAAAEPVDSGAVLTVGDVVPEFEGLNHAGELVKSSSLSGKPYVIYFYPKDDTPGCTTEACGFNEERAAFAERGVEVIGVSPDSPESHARFRKKHGLEFTLLADTERKLVTRFGVWKLKQNYGREYWGVERSTFLVDKEGKIAQVWRGVRVAGHVPAVLEAAARL